MCANLILPQPAQPQHPTRYPHTHRHHPPTSAPRPPSPASPPSTCAPQEPLRALSSLTYSRGSLPEPGARQAVCGGGPGSLAADPCYGSAGGGLCTGPASGSLQVIRGVCVVTWWWWVGMSGCVSSRQAARGGVGGSWYRWATRQQVMPGDDDSCVEVGQPATGMLTLLLLLLSLCCWC
jgi:hypothetical protein